MLVTRSFTGKLAVLFFNTGCKSGKISKTQTPGSNQSSKTTSLCDQTIRYYADKLSSPDEQAVSAHTEIVINPLTKRINLKSEPPDQEKVDFDTVIESVDCNINADWTEGQAIYDGYIIQPDGAIRKARIKLEAKGGSITISAGDQEGKIGLVMPVSKWELVHE